MRSSFKIKDKVKFRNRIYTVGLICGTTIYLLDSFRDRYYPATADELFLIK